MRITATEPRWLYVVLTFGVAIGGAVAILGYVYFYFSYSYAIRQSVRTMLLREAINFQLSQIQEAKQ